jgi:hypothetical protein
MTCLNLLATPQHSSEGIRQPLLLPDGGDRPDATAPMNSLAREVMEIAKQANHADNDRPTFLKTQDV